MIILNLKSNSENKLFGFNPWLRARPKAERVFAEYENFLKLSDPTDRPTDRPWRFSASYIFWTKLPIDKRFSASESHIQ